jgi:hypothetical protein
MIENEYQITSKQGRQRSKLPGYMRMKENDDKEYCISRRHIPILTYKDRYVHLLNLNIATLGFQ